ncbi:MAG TPA: NADP-dependent malic enzyme [Rhodospirillaceae bacterium]|jgi:malate dehydrogenase (oxaloacetate-decarboxylating)(NADP+)|nr:NADP-dependent malic enzyme [Alphaproteobacteria bacterium]HBH26589.1 NADP-dependent malic enzyme [Rhodospirillaceae bacterium]
MDTNDPLYTVALDYHQNPPGKVSLAPTKPMDTQRDLALAYSPGVAAPCLEIEKDPNTADLYTARANVVAVVSNGTAVLGLGAIGALASKPVMEGKAVLFKKFADIDGVDIEVEAHDPDTFIEIVAALEPSFGAINLEDIKAPECFRIERALKARMNIPVFHDDQHGTAIIVTAAFKNWLEVTGRDPATLRMVTSGAGASAISCMNLMIGAGLRRENIIVCDSKGVIYKGRTERVDEEKAKFAADTPHRTLKEAMAGADIFLGLSTAGLVQAEWVATMADAPLLLTLANPTPEVMPEEARKAKPDAVICTGRSDYPNQVNNVLCFPFIFRGALDVGATAINDAMKMACIEALASLARKEIAAEVAAVYAQETLRFGPDYLIPKPFDPRLMVDLPMAVAKAAMDSGVARRPIQDWAAYQQQLERLFIRTRPIMRPVIERARTDPRRVAFAEGENPKVLQAAQILTDEGLVRPVLIAREDRVAAQIEALGLRLTPGKDVEIINPQKDDVCHDAYAGAYHTIMARRGVTPADARTTLHTNTTVIGAMTVHMNNADALICGTLGHYDRHLRRITEIIGLRAGVQAPAALSLLILKKGPFFLADTHVNPDPSATEMAEIVLLAAEEVRRFGIAPKAALLSHSNFGSSRHPSAVKMREALTILRERAPDLEVDGEMHGDAAVHAAVRAGVMPESLLHGQANLLIFPDMDSAHITFNLLKHLGEGISVGPILLGTARPAHILTPSVTPRGIVNAATLACVESQVLGPTASPGAMAAS